MQKVIVLALILFTAMPAFCEEKDITDSPHFGFQGSVGNNSAMAMQCYGGPPYQEINCAFTQVLISAPNTKDVADRKDQQAKEIDSIEPNDFQKFRKELGPVMDRNMIDEKFRKATVEQKNYVLDMINILEPMATAKNKASLKKPMLDFEDFNGATCSITLNTFQLHFSRISKNKWLYNPGPAGACNVVRVSTLENTDEYPMLWTFTQTTVTADKDPFCQKWVDPSGTMVTSWDAPKAFKFSQCRYIQFGF